MADDDQGAAVLDDLPFQVEQRGISFVPPAQRWARPRDIGAMWAGSSVNVEYFIYGALLMGFGFSFATAVGLIVVGNCSFVLLGVASLQGPLTGTTTFTICRAPFGTRGAKALSGCNWLTQLGFEVEGLILIVGAATVLCHQAGLEVRGFSKVLLVVGAAAIQAVLPYFGHGTMVRVLRRLVVPFCLLYLGVALLASSHANLRYPGAGWSNWELSLAGLAFVIALSGLGWTENGNDYTRYVPADARPLALVGWIFVATAIPEIVVMILGAMTFTFLGTASAGAVWNGANPFLAFEHASVVPGWFVSVFLVFALLQLFAINSLDLYSSGVSLQAMGLRLRRYQAVLLDSVLAGALTLWCVFASTFSLYMKEFVGVIIVWIAPWFGIFICDFLLRRRRYEPIDLQRDDRGGRYFGSTGVSFSAVVAFGSGIVAAITGFSKAPPPVNFPFHWMTPIANHFGGSCAGPLVHGTCSAGWFGGADLSIPLGIGVAALVYLALEQLSGRVAGQREVDAPR